MSDEMGIVCPIMCGQCCMYWRDIIELVEKFPTSNSWSECPNRGDLGCTIGRECRPAACNEHLCERAEAVVYPNPITLALLKKIIERVDQEKKIV